MTGELRIPIVEEEAQVSKRAIDLEHVTVRIGAEEEDVLVHDEVRQEQVEVARVQIDREVAEAPAVRTEGDLTIIPVLEERLVVEKRLFLVEEIHLQRTETTRIVEVPTTLRRTRIDLERQVANEQEST